MKRYVFRLESVRRVRRAQEDIAKAELLRANMALRSANDKVQSATQDYNTVNNHVHGGSNVELIRSFNAAELSRDVALHAQFLQEQAAEVADDKRATYTATAIKVKALDRLDERRREEHELIASRETAADLDDIASGQRLVKGDAK